jgi:cardiolipin synthase
VLRPVNIRCFPRTIGDFSVSVFTNIRSIPAWGSATAEWSSWKRFQNFETFSSVRTSKTIEAVVLGIEIVAMHSDMGLWGTFFYASEWAIRLGMLAVVPLRRSPQAASAWLLLTLVSPWLALILYFLIGWPKMPRWRERLRSQMPELFADVLCRLRNDPNARTVEIEPAVAQAARLATHLGHLQPLAGNAVDLSGDYADVIEQLVADIDKATNHVHLIFYIYGDDPTANQVTDALARAVKRGVTCRVLVDSIGSKRFLKTLLPKLSAMGVAAHPVLPVGLFRRRTIRFDLRNHRKVAVIDGRIGYTGSQNLVAADFKKRFVYEELMARVTGPVVLQLQFVFVTDWFVETGQLLSEPPIFPNAVATGGAIAQVLPSGPDDPTENNLSLILALMYSAQRRIVITTPYFIPDESLLQALAAAALRGVSVHLVLPKMIDHILVGLAQRSYFQQMLDAGIVIHLYQGAFLHAKHISIDDRVAIIGSSNMDIRSFLLNAEVMLVCYDAGVTACLRTFQTGYFCRSLRLTPEMWRARPRIAQLAQNLGRLFSPLL